MNYIEEIHIFYPKINNKWTKIGFVFISFQCHDNLLWSKVKCSIYRDRDIHCHDTYFGPRWSVPYIGTGIFTAPSPRLWSFAGVAEIVVILPAPPVHAVHHTVLNTEATRLWTLKGKTYMSSWKSSKEGDLPLCILPKREILRESIPRHEEIGDWLFNVTCNGISVIYVTAIPRH